MSSASEKILLNILSLAPWNIAPLKEDKIQELKFNLQCLTI